jgi:hypothetical protein
MYILAHLEAIGEQSINFVKISIMSQEEIEDLHIEENNELNAEELYERLTLVVDKGQEPLRIDKFLLHKVVNTSRNKIQNAIDLGLEENEKIFKLPLNMFDEFKEIDEYNEDIFEYIAYNLVIGWLENCMKVDQD